MAYVCDVIGSDEVIERFKMYDCPYFSVWYGNKLKFVYDKEDADIESAAEFLRANLDGIQPNSTALYEIKLYAVLPSKGIDAKTPIRGSFTFKMNPNMSESMSGTRLPISSPTNDQAKFWKERYDELERKINEMSLAGIGSPDPEPEMDPQLQKISGIVDIIDNSPFLQKVGTDLVDMIKNLFGHAKGVFAPVAQTMSGIPAEMPGSQKIETVIAAMIDNPDKSIATHRLEILAESLRLLLEKDPDLLNTLDALSRLPAAKYNMAKTLL
jgi:hypothetical protein